MHVAPLGSVTNFHRFVNSQKIHVVDVEECLPGRDGRFTRGCPLTHVCVTRKRWTIHMRLPRLGLARWMRTTRLCNCADIGLLCAIGALVEMHVSHQDADGATL